MAKNFDTMIITIWKAVIMWINQIKRCAPCQISTPPAVYKKISIYKKYIKPQMWPRATSFYSFFPLSFSTYAVPRTLSNLSLCRSVFHFPLQEIAPCLQIRLYFDGNKWLKISHFKNDLPFFDKEDVVTYGVIETIMVILFI